MLKRYVKVRAKQRVYEAYRVAHHIYKNHPDKPQSEITALITEALRPLNFFDGRGYFFIYTRQGLSVMHGLKPEMEGHSIWDEQDSRGKYIFQEFITLISQKGESFYQWRQQKPGHPENEQFTKIGFGKQFEPYGWLIGTGEYVVDVENEIKKQMLKWLSEYEYGEGGYFFVLDPQGTLLAHHYNDFLGLNLTIGNRVDDALFNEINTQVKNGGGYIRYQKPLTVNGAITLEQVSYVKQIKDWEWIIGTGFYSRAFEHYLAKKQQQLAQYNHQSLKRLWGLGVTSVLLLTGVSLYVSHLIARRFDRFQRRIAEDFETLEQTKNKMEFMALHDALTGLPNRLLLLEKIQQCITLSKQNDAYLAVMFVDMDNFKNVNDLHGHAAGDQLLEIVSRKFETILHTPEIVSRFGGDEFIFCFPNLKNTAEAQRKAALIHNVFNEPFVIAGKILSVGCSIGISMYPTDGDDPETLIHEADIVLYKSKSIKKEAKFYFTTIVSMSRFNMI
ncbi:cache domain-containing protein [Vibrio sp. PP-XX7]